MILVMCNDNDIDNIEQKAIIEIFDILLMKWPMKW